MTPEKIKLTTPQLAFLLLCQKSRFGEHSVSDYKPLVTLLKYGFVKKNIEGRFNSGHYKTTEAGEEWLKQNGH